MEGRRESASADADDEREDDPDRASMRAKGARGGGSVRVIVRSVPSRAEGGIPPLTGLFPSRILVSFASRTSRQRAR